MAIYQLGDKKPVIPASCFVADNATIDAMARLLLGTARQEHRTKGSGLRASQRFSDKSSKSL